MSGSSTRDNIARLRRTLTSDNPPQAGELLVGELSLEMSDPMRIWMGVPTGLDPTGRRLLYDRTWIPPGGPFVPISGGLMTGPLSLYADPTQPSFAVTKRYVDQNFAPIAGGGYVQKIGDTMTGRLTIASNKTDPTGPKLFITSTGNNVWPGIEMDTASVSWPGASAAGYIASRRNGNSRWTMEVGGSGQESGGNTGTDFLINRFADDGSLLNPAPLQIVRGTGMINVGTRLMLAVDPTAPLEAVTMRWVQNNYQSTTQGDTRWVNVSGDAMIGALSLSGDPTAPLHAVPMQWIQANYQTTTQGDARWINVSGDAMTGFLSLSGDPTQPLHAVPKQWIEANYSTNAQGDTRWVNVTGDTMTGALTVQGGINVPTNNSGDTARIIISNTTALNGVWPTLILNKKRNTTLANQIRGAADGLPRWDIIIGDGGSETGTNKGSDFYIQNYDDAGNLIGTPFILERATGRANFRSGIRTNDNVATLANDLTQHIDLYGGVYGFSVTGSTLNIVTGINTAFVVAATQVAWLNSGGFIMDGGTDITLARDPTAAMHAVTKQWADGKLALYLPLTGGTLTGTVQFNAGVFMNAGLQVQGGELTVGWAGAGGAFARLNTAPGYYKAYNFQSNSLSRWDVGVGGTAEPVDGSNAGADLIVQRFNDAGALMGAVLTFNRATGLGTVLADPTAPLGIATKKYADNVILAAGGPFLPLSAGAGVPLTGLLYLQGLLPTLDQHATNKLYVDQRDAILAQEIAALSQNLVFVGQIDVTTDSATYTTASGIPSPGPLPAPQDAYKGFYVIVIVPGTAKQPSNIPPGDYVRSDWLVCDGTTWIWLKLGLVYFTAAEVEVLPTIEGTDTVQETLQWLSDNKVDLDGDTLTGPLYLHADPTTDAMSANKHYVDGVITRAGGPFLPIAGGTLTGPLISTGLTDQSGNIVSGTTTNSTGSSLTLVAAPSTPRALKWFSGSHVIWSLSSNNPELGGVADSGGDLGLYRYSDTGAFLGTAFTVYRKAGNVDFGYGISFSDQVASQPADLTKHINLYGGQYGLSITAFRLNIVTNGTSTYTAFVNNGLDVATISGTGLTVFGNTDITLSRDPSQPLHAVHKGWLEAYYTKTTDGDARWVNTTGDLMSGSLRINFQATDTTPQLWLSPAGGGDLSKSILRFNGTFAAAVGDGAPRYVASIRSGFASNAWGYEHLDIWLNTGANDANSDANQARIARFNAFGLDVVGGIWSSGGLTVGTDVTLGRNPTQAMHAVNKQYADAQNALYLPLTGGTLTGPLLVPQGTAAAPSLASSVSPTTGIFFPSTTIHLVAGGTDVLIVSASNLRSLNPYRAPDGTSSLPAYTFASEASSGLYRISAGNIALSVSGNALLSISAANGVIANTWLGTSYNTSVTPPVGGSGLMSWNRSQSGGEVNFYNTYGTGFDWRAVTGAGSEKTLAALDSGGSLSLNGFGVRYNGVTGGGNIVAFAWANSAVQMFVDGTNQGYIASQSWANSVHVAKSGDQMSGGLSFGSRMAASPTDLTQHLSLYDGWGGLSVTGGALNFVAGGNLVMQSGGVSVDMKQPLLLIRDPQLSNEASTKSYVDGLAASSVSVTYVDNQTNVTTGPTGGVSAFYIARTDTLAMANPGNGNISWTDASHLNNIVLFSRYTSDGQDMQAVLGGLANLYTGMQVRIQNKNNSAQYTLNTVTNYSDQGGYFALVVTTTASSGMPFAASTPLMAVIVTPYLALRGGVMTGPIDIYPRNNASPDNFPRVRLGGYGGLSVISLNAIGGSDSAFIRSFRSGVSRWNIALPDNTDETGTLAGGYFTITPYGDGVPAAVLPAALTINRKGNFGFGVVPPPTQAQAAAASGGGWLFAWGATLNNWAQNAYYDGTTWRYRTAAAAGQTEQVGGQWKWQNAPTGAADAAATMTTRMTLDAAGNLSVYGTVTPNQTSDERLKRDIEPYTRGLAELCKLRPILFRWNGLGGRTDDGEQRIGLIAQHTREHIPEVVYETPEPPHDPTLPRGPDITLPGQLSLDDRPLIFAAINAIRELSEMNAALVARVGRLEQKRTH